MRDYRKHLGRNVNVVDSAGESFRGLLKDVGRDTITLDVKEHYFDDGEKDSNTFAGYLMLDRFVIRFVQVL